MLEEMLRGTSRGIVGFDPTTIPGCTVWFDAADPATFGLSGTSLQTWRSKGSASCTATYKYNAPSVSTISGLSTIYFNGVSTMMTTNSIASYGAIETTWITCATNFRAIADTASSVVIATISGSAGGERSIRFDPNATAYSVNTSVFRGSSGDNTNGIRGFIDTAAYFATFTNGSLVTSNTTAVTFQAGVNQGFQIGQWGTWLNGYVYEILIYNRALSLGEYQSVEGYLSQKWGFSPAKVFTPLSIPGCALWLDGMDPLGNGSVPANGATVSTWIDKSINGRNATGGVSPTYNTSQKAIVFNGSSWLTTSYSSVPTNETTFIVYQTTTSALAANCFIIGPTNIGGRLILTVNENDGFGLSFKIGSYGVANGSRLTMAQNQMYIGTTTIASTTSYVYLNGTQGPSSTLTYSGTGTTQIGTAASGSGIYIGYIYEIVIYNTNLTTPQQQAIEGYLAWKWNLQGSLAGAHPNYLTTGNFVKSLTLATTHPYYSLPPATRAFTPIDLPGCLLWFDAADRTTITTSGTNVTQWTNKGSWSGSATNLTGYFTSGTATYNNLNIIQAPVGTHMGFTVAIPAQARAWFAVFRQTTQVTTTGLTQYFAIVNQTAGSGQDGIAGPMSPTNAATATYSMGEGASGIGAWINTATAPNGYNVMSQYAWINSLASTSSNYITVNGEPMVLNINSVATSYRTDSVQYSINTAGYNNSCDIAEIILFNNEITVGQRQSIEGYLAAKWGLKASMPAFVNPTSIPGCALWFDGNDPAGTGVAPANGASVSAWVNKGTTAVTMAYGTSQPTFSSNFQNGFGSVAFNGNYFSGACSFNLAAKSGFLVCSQSSSVTDSPQGFLSFYGSGADTVGSTNGYGYQASQGGPTFGWLYDIFSTGYYLSIGGSTNTPIAVYSDVFASGTQQTFKNGTAGSTATPSSTPGTSTTLMLGARLIGGSLRGSLYGNICEVIVYNVGLSIAQRQTVEGYLAWKWGLQAQLPATHPFYAAAPLPHSFNKVPPTIRQPALYYDVAPGNWTRDWQPYLQALVAANSGATASLSLTGVTASSTVESGSGVLAPNGNIYFSVGGGGSVLSYYNPTANTVSTITLPQGIDSPAAVLGADGNVYMYPINANTGQNIIKITTSTNVATTISAGTNGWWGMILAPNGNLYGIPQRTMNNSLVLNTSTGATSTITGTTTGYWGGVLAPNGKIYCIPGPSNVAVIDPIAGTLTANAVSGSGQTNGYFGGVLGWDGNIYCIPTGTTVGVINPITNTFTTFASNSVFYSGGCLGPDGKIYCIPRGGGAIGVINIATQTFSASSMTLASVSHGYNGATLTPSGTIYVAPYNGGANSHTIYQITFTGLTQKPSLNYCLSAYTNKF